MSYIVVCKRLRVKDTERKCDAQHKAEDHTKPADNLGTQLAHGDKGQVDLHPGVYRAKNECHPCTDKTYHKQPKNVDPLYIYTVNISYSLVTITGVWAPGL